MHEIKHLTQAGAYKMEATNKLKWFRVQDNYIDGERPLAQIAGYPENGPEWYCLKQWYEDSEGGEWRDVEIIV